MTSNSVYLVCTKLLVDLYIINNKPLKIHPHWYISGVAQVSSDLNTTLRRSENYFPAVVQVL